MIKNGQTYFKNLAVFTPSIFISLVSHFSTLCMEGINWKITMREKCPYSEFFWSIFSGLECFPVFNPNAGKCGPDKLRIQALFTQCYLKAVEKYGV